MQSQLHGIRWAVPATAAAVSFTRKRVVAQLLFWGVHVPGDVSERLELLVSELATNAVEHTGGSEVRLAVAVRSGEVFVSISDDSLVEPVVRRAGDDEESGRGMFLVEALASAWGVERSSLGKEVWFTMSLPVPRSAVAVVAPPPRPQVAIYASTRAG